MIGRIAGRLVYRGADHVLIDVRGVGYVVHVSERTLAELPAPGGAVAVFTELVVREDLLQLFGFTTLAEKEWHRLLTSVQGVGAKASMAMLGALGGDGVGRAIALGDWAALRGAPGIGPKIAQRVVNELRDKAPGVMAMGAGMAAAADGAATAPQAEPDTGAATGAPAPQPEPPARGRGTASAESLSALVNLGYGQGEAAAAVAEAQAAHPDADTAALIRAALGLLAPKG